MTKPIRDQVSLPVGESLTLPIGQHEFTIHLGNMNHGRKLVDLVEVNPPLPYLSHDRWTQLLLVLKTALAFEGVPAGKLRKDLFMGIKDGLVV